MIKALSAACAVVLWCASGLLSSISADGLSSEYVITDRWRDYRSMTSPLANPSFLAEEDFLSLRTATSLIMGHAFTLLNADFVAPLPFSSNFRHSVGLSYVGALGAIDRYYFDASDNPVVNGQQGYSNNSITLGYGTALLTYPSLKLFRFGANINFMHQSNFDTPLNDASFDLGVSVVADSAWRIGYQRIGISWMNIASVSRYETPLYTPNLRLSWSGSYRLPSGMGIRGGIDYMKKNLGIAFTGNTTVRFYREDDVEFRIGAIDIFKYFSVFAHFGSGYGGISVHASLVGNKIPRIGAGYQALLTESTGDPTTTYYVDADFVVRDTLWHLSAEPFKLYNEALGLYYRQNFWDAFDKFAELSSHFPDFFKNRGEVQFYSASCLEELGMRKRAILRYKEAMELCAKNKDCLKGNYIAKTLTGLLRIYYRQGSLTDMTNICADLNAGSFPQGAVLDSLRAIGDYYRGEVFFREKMDDSASVFLSKVPPQHPLSLYARYTHAVAQYRTSCAGINDTSKICKTGRSLSIEILKNNICDSHGAVSEDVKEINARGHLLLARIYYDADQMTDAMKQLRCVPRDSRYYEDVFECFAWCSYKMKKWSWCEKAAKDLKEITEDSVLICQAALLEASALSKTDKTTEALNVLAAVEPIAKTLIHVDSATLKAHGALQEQMHRELDLLGETFDTTAHVIIENHYSTGRVVRTSVLTESKRTSIIDGLSKSFKSVSERLQNDIAFCERASKWYCDSSQIDSIKMIVPIMINKIMRNTASRLQKAATPEVEKIDHEIKKLKSQLKENTIPKIESQPDENNSSDPKIPLEKSQIDSSLNKPKKE